MAAFQPHREPSLFRTKYAPAAPVVHLPPRPHDKKGGRVPGRADLAEPVMEWTRERYRETSRAFAPFMSSLASTLGRSERRLAATQYVGGLLLPGQCKRLRPLAVWLGIDHQSLQQFLTNSPWNDQDVWSAIRQRLLARLDSIDLWLIELRAWEKQGKHSVGVSYQSSGPHIKKRNCQISIEVLLGRKSVAAPVAGHLYLPETWAGDDELRHRAGVPHEVPAESRAELAIRLIGNVLEDGVPKAPVVADSGFGDDSGFRRALRTLGLEYFLEINPRKHWGYGTGDGRRATSTCLLDQVIMSGSIQDWEYVFYPNGKSRGSRFLWQRILLTSQAAPPEPCWLVAEWPQSAQSYYRAFLANLRGAPSDDLSSALFTSTECLRNHQSCFERILDLNSYQGRTWSGFHHHLVLAAAACAFVVTQELERHGLRVAETPSDPLILGEAMRMAALI